MSYACQPWGCDPRRQSCQPVSRWSVRIWQQSPFCRKRVQRFESIMIAISPSILCGGESSPRPSINRIRPQHDYPAGSVLSLVTWSQQEDPRWFGENIPAAPKSVEFVTVGVTDNHKRVYSYQDYEGAPLKKISAQESPRLEGRTAYLLSQPAAVMP